MEIYIASIEDFEEVKRITQGTIDSIYPHYYPKGVVEFFKDHHSDENIMADIQMNKVYLAKVDGINIATVTINHDEINRLFVLPSFQRKGYGNLLMEFAEEKILRTYQEVQLHASLPGKKLYIKRGYVEKEYRTKMVAYEDVICVDIMRKKR